MRRVPVYLAAFLTLGTPSVAGFAPRYAGYTDNKMLAFIEGHKVIPIQRGEGGEVGQTRVLVKRIISEHRKVVIDGPCYSSCVMYLTLPKANVCWTGASSFYLHSAWNRDERNGEKVRAPAGNATAMRMYPKVITDWIVSAKVFSSFEFTELPRPILEKAYGDKRCQDSNKAKLVLQG